MARHGVTAVGHGDVRVHRRAVYGMVHNAALVGRERVDVAGRSVRNGDMSRGGDMYETVHLDRVERPT
jgi:hypothetical protein